MVFNNGKIKLTGINSMEELTTFKKYIETHL
jgi:hypothetical protein